MINAYLYAVVGVCGLVLMALNLNVWSLLCGSGMAIIGLVAAFRQYRRVKAARTAKGSYDSRLPVRMRSLSGTYGTARGGNCRGRLDAVSRVRPTRPLQGRHPRPSGQ